MTAALSVLPSQGEKGLAADAYEFVDEILTKRLNQTV